MPLMNNLSLSSIVESGFCSGCGLCVGVFGAEKIRMQMSDDGFLRPVPNVALDGGDRRLLNRVCPGIHVEHDRRDSSFDRIWGPIRDVHTAYSTDAEVRRLGSSGGVISALALYLLDTGKVDFVGQIAVSNSDPLANQVQKSTSRDDVVRAAGSRYAPAAPLSALGDWLASGQSFALIGKPCDIAAVRNLARVDSRVGNQVRYLISFMCAGVPSIWGTHEILNEMNVDSKKVCSFRYRGDGWPGFARAVTSDGASAEMDYSKSWGTILSRHLQFRCKICPDGTGEFADITCADAWYGEGGYPDFAEREGRSLLLSRTKQGNDLVSGAEQAGYLIREKLAIEEIAAMQPYQVARKQFVSGRLLAVWVFSRTLPKFSHLGLLNASFRSNPFKWLRSAIGTFARLRKK